MKSLRPCWLLGLVLLGACSTVTDRALPPTPLFVPDPRDLPRAQAISREQDALLLTCAETHTCDRVHFTRALAALYENQALAARHFRDVIDIAPKSRLAVSSQYWLRFLNEPPSFTGRTNSYAEATDHLLRDLLELESSSALTLQREVKTRDKTVEDLAKQLDALKRVDQEMRELKEKNRR